MPLLLSTYCRSIIVVLIGIVALISVVILIGVVLPLSFHCCCCHFVLAMHILFVMVDLLCAHIPQKERGIAGAWGTLSSFGVLMWQPPLTLKDQAQTNTQVVQPLPPHRAMT